MQSYGVLRPLSMAVRTVTALSALHAPFRSQTLRQADIRPPAVEKSWEFHSCTTKADDNY